MLEKVNCKVNAIDNYLEITPDDGIKNNCLYEIRINKIKSADGSSELTNQKVLVYTKITPAYSTIEAVRSLLMNCDEVTDSTILYHIRDASKFVEYVTNKKYGDNDVPFNVFQFVKYKAAYDSLISFSVNNISLGITKGTMGDVGYEKSFSIGDITKLIKLLKDEYDKWYDSLFDAMYTGPASPKITVKSSYILHTDIRNDYPPYRSYMLYKTGCIK